MSTASGNKPAQSMAELLQKHSASFVALKKGEVIKAKVSKITSSEILLDVGAKTEAVVLEKDRKILRHLLGLLHVGDTVEASVLTPEGDMGYPIVSLRRFADNATWKLLEELLVTAEKINVTVTDSTKGGFLVEAEGGISGFLPQSHVPFTEDMDNLVGKTIKTSIVDLNREHKKVIFSAKDVLNTEAFKSISALLKKGETVHGVVSGMTSFGLFITLTKNDKTLEGFVYISEISWEKIDDISSHFQIGQPVEAVVLGTDEKAKRIDLSLKRLQADPFEEVVRAYPVDKKVSGTVTKIEDAGILLTLSPVGSISAEGMIRKEKIPPTTIYTVGQSITATVVQADSRKRRILLTPVLLEKPLMYR